MIFLEKLLSTRRLKFSNIDTRIIFEVPGTRCQDSNYVIPITTSAKCLELNTLPSQISQMKRILTVILDHQKHKRDPCLCFSKRQCEVIILQHFEVLNMMSIICYSKHPLPKPNLFFKSPENIQKNKQQPERRAVEGMASSTM